MYQDTFYAKSFSYYSNLLFGIYLSKKLKKNQSVSRPPAVLHTLGMYFGIRYFIHLVLWHQVFHTLGTLAPGTSYTWYLGARYFIRLTLWHQVLLTLCNLAPLVRILDTLGTLAPVHILDTLGTLAPGT